MRRFARLTDFGTNDLRLRTERRRYTGIRHAATSVHVLDYRLRYCDDFGHVRTFAPAELRELVEEAGFTGILFAKKRLGPISSLLKPPAAVARRLHDLATRSPTLADDVLLIARKASPPHPGSSRHIPVHDPGHGRLRHAEGHTCSAASLSTTRGMAEMPTA